MRELGEILTAFFIPMINTCIECICGFFFSLLNGESGQSCDEGLVPKIFDFHVGVFDKGGLLFVIE
ncbi:hypothetical protein TB9_19710 [Xanthomonas perforans]|uniref:Uncharacterized protein n=1 Tax=Xanthomonas perforans TaxID=442694 RepID=A0AAQ0YKT5_XANPE|nr:hypothetical protein XP315_00665 [Xanthomonas perforans]KUF28152.1 hypothetical protein AO826_07025 [Xanthomonas phaseoli pv. manihotis]KLC18149.1 hypothetical protein XP816_21615 [Xanthomonas perforans]KLC29027.1 hypothetical protein XP1013_19085 [Xanthomonas perforans]KLC52375.1 hypothetical protein XP2010_19240 [Xanthomonas perforans]